MNNEELTSVLESLLFASGNPVSVTQLAEIVGEEARDVRDELTYSAEELEQIEQRLDVLHKLKRKYGASVEDVLAFLEQARSQLDEI